MKRLFVSLFAILLTLPLFAEQNRELETYLRRALMDCPGSTTRIEKVDSPGPRNFQIHRVEQSSSERYCGGTQFALISPKTGQVLLGHIVSLGDESKTLEQTISSRVSKMMGNSAIRTAISPKQLDDGLRRVDLTREGGEGNMTFHAFLDESNRFLIVGRLGHLTRDPREDLLRALAADRAVARGARPAQVHIVELSDFQCPMCRKAHETLEPLFRENQDRISYARIDLPLTGAHDWTLKASLGAHAIQQVAPRLYWDYVDYIFSHQDKITKGTIDDVVQGFASMHDLDWNGIEPLYRSKSQREKILGGVGLAFGNGIFATPTFIVNGQPVYFGADGSHMKNYLHALLAGEKPAPSAH